MYTKIIQSGNQIEVYKYSKKLNVHRQKRNYRKNKRFKKTKNDSRPARQYRSIKSIQRARSSFFRLVAANLETAELPAFITLTFAGNETDIRYAYQCLNKYTANLRKVYPRLSYIVVPEWQKRGALHFHCLTWGTSGKDHETEHQTRNHQRLWARGYVDVRAAKNNNLAIAGYMAKYLVKALEDTRLSNQRAYSTSRNIKRPTAAGSNQLSEYMDVIMPDSKDLKINKVKNYDTMWLGSCEYIKYNKK